MKTILLIVALALSASSVNACEWRTSSFSSSILPLVQGAPWRVSVLTLLPTGYDPTLTYGVVYFLHGLGNRPKMLKDVGACEALDEHVRRGGKPFIMVAMNGNDYYWMNGATNGIRMGDVVTQEWIRDTESRFRVFSTPSGRVISGISMGGHGALQLAINYPNVYGAVGSHSPVFRSEYETYLDFPGEFGRGRDFARRDPVTLIRENPRALTVPIYYDIGGRDPYVVNTVQFGRVLQPLVSPLSVFQAGTDWLGGHEGAYWRYHFLEYAAWYGARLPAPRR